MRNFIKVNVWHGVGSQMTLIASAHLDVHSYKDDNITEGIIRSAANITQDELNEKMNFDWWNSKCMPQTARRITG